MAHDGDILQIKVFSAHDGYAKRAMDIVAGQVNVYLSNYPAELVHSIQPQVTEFTDTEGESHETCTRYTVLVTLRS